MPVFTSGGFSKAPHRNSIVAVLCGVANRPKVVARKSALYSLYSCQARRASVTLVAL